MVCDKFSRPEHESLEIKIRAAKSILENPLPTEQTKKFVRKQLTIHESRLVELLSSKEASSE